MIFLEGLLLFFAVLGPVLTFSRLLQIKEWRADRLREHLRQKGYVSQLFGLVRPVLIGLGLLTLFFIPLFPAAWEMQESWILLSTYGTLAWFTLFQGTIGQRKRPVWTAKAMAVVSLSLILFLSAFTALQILPDGIIRTVLFLLLPLLSPVVLGLSLFILSPLDRWLKRRLLQRAQEKRAKYTDLTVIGITGSVGKSTTKEMLAHVLQGGPPGGEKEWKVLLTPAHVNTELGVADVLLRSLKKDHTHLVVEMGAYRKGEIALLASLALPQIGITTFVSDQHVGLFGSREALLSAKGELFASLPPEGHAFLNADSEGASAIAECAGCPVITVGTGGHANFEAFDIVEESDGISFTLRGIPFRIPLHGTHQVANVLLVTAAAEVLDIPIEETARRLQTFHGLPQTFEKKTGKHGQVVLDDTHNASSASFRAAIEWARMYPAERKVLVTSGLIELGGAERLICEELGNASREIFQEVIFLDRACARCFEHGFGQSVTVPRRKRDIRLPLREGALIVCEGRIPDSLMQKVLS
jgi:UDP-N-acetylmuramoyl-tripeptide--D-alanyl-D-alanine ligase